MDGVLAVAVEVLRRGHGGSRESECHSRAMMSWQQALRKCHGTLEPRLNPTSSSLSQQGKPMILAPPEPVRVRVRVGMWQLVWKSGMEQVRPQVAEWVMQLVQEIPPQEPVQAQGSVIFQLEMRPKPPGLLVRPGHVH